MVSSGTKKYCSPKSLSGLHPYLARFRRIRLLAFSVTTSQPSSPNLLIWATWPEQGFEVWIGDAAEIRRQRVRKQKTDREDARLLLRLLQENRFPRIWVPSPENRDLRQLLWHRHRLVQMRTRIMNQLQAVAMNEGYRWKKKLFSEQGRTPLEKLSLAPWASRRRKELLELLDQLDPKIAELTTAVEQEAQQRPEVLRLMTHPGVGSRAYGRG